MRFSRVWCVFLLLIMSGVTLVNAQDEKELYEGRYPASEFPDGLEWINVEQPLSIAALKGKVVILDFWTYGCINCIHMIPVLRQLEEKYPDELVVIGVHSAKFGPAEGQTDNIRQIVARYDIHHPVINDKDFIVWQSYNVRAWPTFGVVDPHGNIVALQSGEIPFEAFDDFIGGMIAYYDGLGDVLDRTPRATFIENATAPSGLFSFPGKVMVDTDGNRLFIADSSHQRIAVMNLETRETEMVIGSGARGLKDGDFETAQFDSPQGMALRNDTLYVADTNNHAIRAVDLTAKTVTTIAGTGAMGHGLMPFDMVVSDTMNVDLRSPWDLTFDDTGRLLIAMAGTHQVWQFNLEENTMQALIGSGEEGQKNGDFPRVALAQPSGLFYQDGMLYIADPESSTIRAANLETQQTQVIAGVTDNDLFAFGDIDGPLGENRLQHALGVTGDDSGILYFADTYNNKIKRYDPATQETTTLMGLGGNGGYRDGSADVAEFDEPGGIAYSDGLLYVADTNNHAIRIIDLEANTVSTLQIANPEMLQSTTSDVTIVGGNAASGESMALPDTPVKAGEGEIVLTYEIPEGFKLNTLAVSTVDVTQVEDGVAFESDSIVLDGLETHIPVTFTAGETPLTLEATLFYCEAELEAFCLVDVVTISGTVTVTEDADSSTLNINRAVEIPVEYQVGGFGTK